MDKIHRGIKFYQSPFMKEYIDYCTKKRSEATSDFGKRIWKLQVNSCYGKFVEDARKYLTCKFVQDVKIARKLIRNPRFNSMMIIRKDLIVIFLNPEKIVLNKPYIIGFTILELSKNFMYSEFYRKIKPALGECDILFTDTDSLAIVVNGNRDPIKSLSKFIDFSNYPKSHPRYNNSIANALGYWKDEMKGNTISEFVGLRSKTYALKVEKFNTLSKGCINLPHASIKSNKIQIVNSEVKTTCKGVKKAYKKNIPFSAFVNCLSQVASVSIGQYRIKSSAHSLSTVRMENIAFSSFDDKRYLSPCGIHSVPYGSKYIKKMSLSKKCFLC